MTRSLLPDGDEPDPRFTLANERTFLAWMRTSLALIGGGVALEAFPIAAVDPVMRRASAIILVVIGLVLSIFAMRRWIHTERAMRLKQPLSVPAMIPLLGGGVAVVSIMLIVMIISVG